MADAIADSGVLLPGVSSEVATSACFAGQWTERRKSGAAPVAGLRIYELMELNEIGSVEGNLCRASSDDRDLMIHVHVCSAESIRVRNFSKRRVVRGEGSDSPSIDQRSDDGFGSHSAVARIRPAEDFINQKEHRFLIRSRPDSLA